MRASSSHCRARRSISAIRPAARWLASTIAGVPLVEQRALRRGRRGLARARRPAIAISRCRAPRVRAASGWRAAPSGSPAPCGAARQQRSTERGTFSSSCRLRHWRTRASAQKTGSLGSDPSAPALGIDAARDLRRQPPRPARPPGRATGARRRWWRAGSRRRTPVPAPGGRATGDAEPPTASARMCSVSLKPSNNRGARILSSASASSPGRRVIRWPGQVPAVH